MADVKLPPPVPKPITIFIEKKLKDKIAKRELKGSERTQYIQEKWDALSEAEQNV